MPTENNVWLPMEWCSRVEPHGGEDNGDLDHVRQLDDPDHVEEVERLLAIYPTPLTMNRNSYLPAAHWDEIILQWKNFLGIGGNGLIDALEAYDA